MPVSERDKHLIWKQEWPKNEKPGCCTECGCNADLSCKHMPITDAGCNIIKGKCWCCRETMNSSYADFLEAERRQKEDEGQLRLF